MGLGTAAALALVSLIAAVHSDDDGTDVEARESLGPVQGEIPAFPFSSPAVATGGNTVAVVRSAPDSTLELHSLHGGDPILRATLPFADPVAYPDVLAVGDHEYIIAGVPCARTEQIHDSQLDCFPGGVTVARFDTNSDAFQVLEVRSEFEQSTPYVDLIGYESQRLFVQIGGELYSLSTSSGELVPLGSPPTDAGMTVACLAGGSVVTLAETYPGRVTPDPGELVEEESGLFVPFEAAVYDPDANSWTPAVGPSARYDVTDTFEYGCSNRGVVAVPSERPMLESSPYVTFIFDPIRSTWLEAQPPPREFLGAAPTATDGRLLALSVSSDIDNMDNAILVYDVEVDTWTERMGGEGSSASAVAVAADQVVTVGSNDDHRLSVTVLPS